MGYLNIQSPNFPPIAAGMLYGLALVLFIDGVVQANQEAGRENHFSFVMCIPAIFSTIGLLILHLVSPAEIKEGDERGRVLLFTSWLAMFGSTVGALVIVFFCFTGMQSRTRAAPGVSLVLYTCVAPIVASILWWGRRVAEGNSW
ncbi:hypothetical protein ABL78_1133 [Leptomonas seymouri]|uniref:Uncharacterized protein n=1 Tax=Leptomonas seymouri TaxID=5684 RepID=A0A0N1IM91_LEPSE|nr:hypothetical protein ABL78_1133 [Leptomonas seymouri]|eukprot:KPI89753.1 hypothetical protein ABL78_1133 [Leptomonas seymouri]